MARLQKAIKEQGIEIDVHVQEDGWFRAGLDGQEYRAQTLEELKVLMRSTIRAKARKVSIPATGYADPKSYWRRGPSASAGDKQDHELVEIEVVGVRAGRRGELLARKDGKSFSTTYVDKVFRRLTPEESADYLSMLRQRDQLDTSIALFEEEHRLRAQDVEAAIEAAVTPAAEASV